MIKRLIPFLLLFFISIQGLLAEYRIEIDIKDYKDSMIVIGYYYGEQTLVLDTLYKNDSQKFVLQGEDTLHTGVYLFLTKPDNKFVQFMVNENEQNFSVSTNAAKLDKVQFLGSEDNSLFYTYLDYLSIMRANRIALESDSLISKNEKSRAFEILDKKVVDYQKNIVDKYPNTITSLLLKSNFQVDIPEFEGPADSVQLKKYLYFKNHYFDNIDLSNPFLIHTPFLHERINHYLSKLTVQLADSLIKEIDMILLASKAAPETYKYYLSHFLNTYAKSKVVGFDAIYVHLVEEYYAKGEAPWIEKENLAKIVDNAARLKPILIGKTAPDFTVLKKDSSAFTLSKLTADFTVLMFWAPDCGHCTKAMPKVVEFYDIYKSKGVEVVAICNKTGSKFGTCWENLEDKNMEEFINVGDQYQRSRIQAKYYVRTTPKIFILDSNKKILVKDIGAEQLSQVMDTLIKSK